MESKKSNVSNKKGKKVISRNKLFLIIIVIVVILCFVIGAIVLNTKDDSKPGDDGKVDNSQGDSGDGTIVVGGNNITSERGVVRPAMWIKYC